MKTIRKILTDDELDRELQTKGYVVVPFLNVDESEKLVNYFRENNELEPRHFYASAHSEDLASRRRISEKIKDSIHGTFKKHFNNCTLLGGSFVVKPKNSAEKLQPHQDWNIVDEKQFRSFNIWIPLIDLTEKNGAIKVLPESHLWLENYRHSSIPCSFGEVHELAWEIMPSLYLKAGEALIYDHALLHASLPNLSDDLRIACACGVIPDEAEMRFYWNNAGIIEEYESSSEFFMTKNVFEGPHELKRLREINYQFPAVTADEFYNYAGIEKPAAPVETFAEPEPKRGFLQVYTPMNILREITYRLGKKMKFAPLQVPENSSTSPEKKHTVEDVGAFYDTYTDKFLQVYGEIIQAYRTHDVGKLLDYQIEAMELKEGVKALDAGCGVCGPATYFAARTGAEIKAVTISREQVSQAEEKIKQRELSHLVTVKQGDYHDLKAVFPSEEFDVVYFLESFGHSPDQARAIDSAWEVLKPGGLLYIKDLFIRRALLPEHQPKIDREVRKINEAYRYNIAELNDILDHLRRKGWILAAVKTIDLKLEDFENLTISNEFQELTGIARIDSWDDYVFPIDFFELKLYKPQFDLENGLDKYFLQNLMYMQIHHKKQEDL